MRENLKLSRLLKKTHMLRCRSIASLQRTVSTPPLVDFSRASHLDLFEQPARGFFQHPIRRMIGALVIALSLAPQDWSVAAESKSAEQIVDALQKNYDATVDFVADFQQETEVKALNRSLKAWGKLSFKRPGKMLWRYEEPKGQIVLTDGSHLYFLQPEQNQVIKSPLKNAFRSDIPLSFLLGLGNLKKDFNAILKATEKDQYILRLEPKGEAGGFSEILMGVSRSSADIVWVSIRDAANNLTSLRFSNMTKGVGLQDSLFRIKIPEGMDIVELGQ